MKINALGSWDQISMIKVRYFYQVKSKRDSILDLEMVTFKD